MADETTHGPDADQDPPGVQPEPDAPVSPVRRGRPRSAAADASLARAVLELLAEVGYSGLTMEQAAGRAGVGKTTLYRRHRSRAELVLAAIEPTLRPDPIRDRGSLTADLTGYVDDAVRRLSEPGVGWALPGLVGDASSDEQLADRLDEAVGGPEREALAEIFDRAVRRGELLDLPDPDPVRASLTGEVFAWLYLLRKPVPEDLPARLAERLSTELRAEVSPVAEVTPIGAGRRPRRKPPKT